MYRRYDFSNPGENETTRLKPHPLNEKIYGDSVPDAELKASIAENGIFNPIIINKNKEILSGTRRWLAAKAANFKKVPVLTFQSKDPDGLLSELFLIESNRARMKTMEQISREFTELKRIEGELATQRQEAGPNQFRGLEEILPEGLAGQARDKAAAAVNLSGRTAEKLEKVVRASDSGDEVAKGVLAEVNAGTKSISAAYRAIVPPKDPERMDLEENVAINLSKLFPAGYVHRSSKPGLFHLMVRFLTPKQIEQISTSLKEPE